jgi:hypothetical protein
MVTPAAPSFSSALAQRIAPYLFLALLLFNGWGVSVGWKNLNLPGCEFRQAQTALSALFIQRDHDFSLAYPTPVLGKPWSVPMEFPLYQWTVVALSNVTGISLTSAGRAVSAICFYLSLPAFYLLFRWLRLDRGQALLALGFIVTCPLYIFYTRSFMIETMALMFGAWYFIALIFALEKRSGPWLVAAAAAGTGAGLVKITTFILFLFPAFACSLFWLWQSRPVGTPVRDWKPLLRTFGWLAAAHAIPFVAARWWVHYADAVKMLNPSGEALTSTNLAAWNFGIGQRFSPVVWAAHWRIFFHELLNPIAAGLCLVAAIFVRGRWLILSLAALVLFLVVQLVFPVLYAWHEYYYVANAFALMTAVALVVVGLFNSPKIPWGAALAVALVVYACQIQWWFRFDYPQQTFQGRGGNSLSAMMKVVADPDEAIVVVGEDWNSMLPYYSERRALMLRDDVIRAPRNFAAALENMKDTPVAALILRENWKGNRTILRKVSETLGIDERLALIWHDGDAEVYLHRDIRTEVLTRLEGQGMNRYGDFTLPPEAKLRDRPLAGQVLHYARLPERHKKLFHLMHPAPESFFSSVGPELWDDPTGQRFFAHPETKLWFALAAGNYHFRTTIALAPNAYTGVPFGDASDGVSLVATLIDGHGQREELRRQHVNPRDNEADRGSLPIDWAFALPQGGQLEIAVTPGPAGNSARDWATLGAINIEPVKSPE